METKRKSTGADGDDRASKRQKTATVPQEETRKGETAASTTEVGLAFLEQIRRTGDKSGRRVAKYFEELLLKDDNKEYYRVVRMPISLGTIEKKLRSGDFANLAELESYVKRMVQNAKDFYPRSSHTYDDAERIRKATSNFMVKHNPAYKLIHGYSALPTPIPEALLEGTPADGDTEEDAASGESGAEAVGEDEDADAKAASEEEEEADEDDGSGEDESDEEDAAEDEDEDEDDDDDDDARPASRRPNSSTASRDTSLRGRRKSTTERATSTSAKPDHEYDGMSYKGLSFQQAQEKIVEEVIRRTDDDDDGYAYFEPFLNLPSRSLKDYFQLIKDPLSLKKLQKLVKGIRSRSDRSGVSEFKNWTAFEEKASLLWENAYFYNEDGSPIANMAKELETMFRGEMKKAKESVPEPPQPKIKIRMTQGQETPAPVTKKITIHVANTRGGSTGSTESPGPKSGGSVPSATSAKSGGVPAALAAHAGLDKTRSKPGVSPSPSAVASTKQESSAHASPAPLPQQHSNGVSAATATAAALPNRAAASPAVLSTQANGTPGTPQANGITTPASASAPAPAAAATPTPVAPPRPAHESKFREPGREPLITNLAMRTHPSINTGERPFELKLPPHPRLTQRSVTLNIPQGQWRHQLIVSLAPSVQQQQRSFKLFVIANGATLGQSAPLATAPADPAEAGGKLYEVNLHPGVNVIQVQVIAGVLKDQTPQSGAEAELDKITIFANLMRY